jgi:hypothetical protein
MDRYIKQVVDELEETLTLSIDPPFFEIPDEMEEFPGEAELEQAVNKPIAIWLDKESKIFPPVNFLNVRHMNQLCQIMVKAFEKINVSVDFPKQISLTEKYNLLLELWDEPVPFLTWGSYHMDFCTGDCEGCRIRQYCEVDRLHQRTE